MLERLKICFFHPSLIGMYSRDKFWRVFSYVVMLIILMMLPPVFEAIKYDGFSNNEFKEMKNSFIAARDSIPACEINNYKFYLSGEKAVVNIQGVLVGFGELPNNQIGVLLEENEVFLCSMGVKICSFTYKELGLDNINFSSLAYFNYADANAVNLQNDFIKLKLAIKYMTTSLKPVWAITYVLVSFLIIVGGFFLISLLFGLILKMGTPLQFSEIYVTVIYGLTIGVFGYVLGSLLSFPAIDYIASLVSIIFVYRAVRILVINRIITKEIKM